MVGELALHSESRSPLLPTPATGSANTFSPETNCTATYTSNDTKFWAPICEDSMTPYIGQCSSRPNSDTPPVVARNKGRGKHLKGD
nr:hypothetical protein Iba_chr01aCG5150 [Ipomoea batatas]